MFRQRIYLRAAETQGVSAQDYPSHHTRIIPRPQPLLATATVTGWNHVTWFRAAQSCLGTGGTGPSRWQSPKGVSLQALCREFPLSSCLAKRHELVKTHMSGRQVSIAPIRNQTYDFHLISPMSTDTEYLDPIRW